MEYVFGTRGMLEVLKTKGNEHTNLTEFQEAAQGEVMHYFRVVRKLESKEDVEGNCYDWYVIDKHSRTIDKSAALEAKLEENEDAICELSIALDQRLGELEDATCELAMIIAGGE